MYQPDPKRVQHMLEMQYDYPPGIARDVAANTPPLRDEFAAAIEAWLRGDELPSVSVEGITLAEVIRSRRCNPLVAARMLGDLLDEGLPTDQRDSLRSMLTTPVVLR
jgi:hypothetical protein